MGLPVIFYEVFNNIKEQLRTFNYWRFINQRNVK